MRPISEIEADVRKVQKDHDLAAEERSEAEKKRRSLGKKLADLQQELVDAYRATAGRK